MSTTVGNETSPVAPEVRLFLARVRHELADLDPDEVDEMTDGLEADLTELVADRGPGALGRPAEYAEELRAAAGLEVRAGGRPARRPVGEAVDGLLDAARDRADSVLDRLPGDVRPLLAWLRPLWWVARAWAALQLGVAAASGMTGIGLYFFEGGRIEPMPPIGGWAWLLLAVAVGGSVQIGRGRLWPGGRRGVSARVVLLVLNVVAVVAVPYLAALVGSGESDYSRGYEFGHMRGYDRGYNDGRNDMPAGIEDQAGIYADGHWVSNIYPYDASGKPLTGVQLFDQTGRPIGVVRGPECPDLDESEDQTKAPQTWSVVAGPGADGTCLDYTGLDATDARVSYPWTNGAAQVDNVYPLATRLQESFLPQLDAFASSTPPAIGAFPMASVPQVSLPGITPSAQVDPKTAKKK
jgi:hypothetical protein